MLTLLICPRCKHNHLCAVTNPVSGDIYTLCEEYPICSYVEDLPQWIPMDLIAAGPHGADHPLNTRQFPKRPRKSPPRKIPGVLPQSA